MSLITDINNCRKCGLREVLDTTLVPAASSDQLARATMVWIKMAPNLDAHLEQEAYSSQEGLLIEKICTMAGVPRDSVYVTNLVKCMSAKPSRAHVEACSDFLKREIPHKARILLGKRTAELYSKIEPDAKFYQIPSLHELYRGSLKGLEETANTIREIYIAH